MRHSTLKWLGLFFFLLFSLNVLAADKIEVCGDEAGWPPFTYEDPKEKQKIIGASADIVREVLKRAGYESAITLVPWKRCLTIVEKGDAQIVMDASYNDERAKKYFISAAYYTIHDGIFYVPAKLGNKPDISNQAVLKNYSFCGIHGYNYEMYPVPADKWDMGAKNEQSRFQKLKAGHCQLVIGDTEAIKGFAALGQLDLAGVENFPLVDSKPKEFHMLITRAASGGEKLHKAIEKALAEIRGDGTFAAIFKKYGI